LGELSDPCAVIEFSIPQVANFSSPPTCQKGYVNTSQNIYTCNGGHLEGVNCDPFGYSATVTVAKDGGCPELPDFSDVDFGSWTTLVKVPVAMVKSLFCVPPKVSATEDPSAKVENCPDGGAQGTSAAENPSGFANGNPIASSAGMLGEFWTTQFVASDQGAQGTYNPFLTWYDKLQDGTPADLSGTLGGLAVKEAGLEGVHVRATVTLEHHYPGFPEENAVHTVHVAGEILTDGRFDCTRRIEGTSQGAPVQIVHRTTFDGQKLRDHSELGEVGNIYTLDDATPAWILQVHADSVDQLSDWARNPFELPMFADGVPFTEVLGGTNLILNRMHALQAGGEFVGSQYEVEQRGGIDLPVRRSEFDAAGNLWGETTWSNFVELRPGDWRPTLAVSVRYLDGNEAGRTVTTRLAIHTATALDAAAASAVPQPFEDNLGWIEWQ